MYVQTYAPAPTHLHRCDRPRPRRERGSRDPGRRNLRGQPSHRTRTATSARNVRLRINQFRSGRPDSCGRSRRHRGPCRPLLRASCPLPASPRLSANNRASLCCTCAARPGTETRSILNPSPFVRARVRSSHTSTPRRSEHRDSGPSSFPDTANTTKSPYYLEPERYSHVPHQTRRTKDRPCSLHWANSLRR